jgi:hypothetical protein
MRCVRRKTDNSLRYRIRNEDLRKLLGTEADIDYIKRQQIKFFGHIIRQKELKIIQRVIIRNKIKNIKNKTNRKTKKTMN